MVQILAIQDDVIEVPVPLYIHNMHACMHACIHTYIHTCIHTYIPCTYMHACMHARMHAYTHTHTHTHTCRGCEVRTCDYAPRTEDPIKTQIKTKLFKYYYLVFRAVRALRWRHLELPEFVPCVLNRWRHTHPILIMAYLPMLFYVKQLLTNRKIVQTAWMTKSNYIFLRT